MRLCSGTGATGVPFASAAMTRRQGVKIKRLFTTTEAGHPGGGVKSLRALPRGPPPPLALKSAKLAGWGQRSRGKPRKMKETGMFSRENCRFQHKNHVIAGSDGVVSTAAFSHGVSCQPQVPRGGFVSGGMRWKIKISAVFWPPARSSSARGVERRWEETQTADRRSSARINAGMTFGTSRNGIRPRN